jgi:hypothetical protein
MRTFPSIVGPVLLLLALALPGCGGGVTATVDSVKAAEAKWKAAGLRNYDLEWANSGMGTGHYRVFVRDGEVKAIYSVLPGGREVVAKPGAPRMYSVDGLFTTIKDEIAQLDQPTPFGQPKGTSAILKFTPDPELGYPKAYRRDVLGTPKGVSIDVLGLDRDPPPAVPPPAADPAGSPSR